MLMTPHSTRRNSPLMPEVLSLLRQWGATVDGIHPDDRCTSLDAVRVEHDLYVLKTRTELGLSIAGALHEAALAQALHHHRRRTLRQSQMPGQPGQRDRPVRRYVVQQLPLVLAQIGFVRPVERTPDPAVQ